MPRALVVLTGVFPRSDVPAYAPVIDGINEKLATLADGKHIVFVNVNDRLSTADGLLRDGMSVDGLHLSARGYDVWAAALEPILEDVLGPRAAEDRAPPPTGNPPVR